MSASMKTADEIAAEMRSQRINHDKTRLRDVIMKLRLQVKNPALLDRFLSNLNPTTAIEGRLPYTPQRVVTVANKTICLHNTLAWAVINWGRLARNEVDPANPNFLNPELTFLERIAETHFKTWGAYPKDRNSAIHVLRTATEEFEVRRKRVEAEERAAELRARRVAGITEEPVKTGLEQDEPGEASPVADTTEPVTPGEEVDDATE